MSSVQHREVEAKFEISPERQLAFFSPDFAVDGYRFQPTGTLSQTDTYLDTPAFDLLRRGLTLRLRQNGTNFEIGIKSLEAARKGAIQDRMDISFPLPPEADPSRPATWPAAIAGQLAPYAIKLKKLHPILLLRQQRSRAMLFSSQSETSFAEWSLDEVSMEAGPSPACFHLLEIEMLAPEKTAATAQDIEAAFANLVAHVQERFELTPIYTSKLVRGLEAAMTQTHGGGIITPAMTLEAAGRFLLHQQLFQIMLNEHGVRSSRRAREIHDMRVAIRRARAAIRLCHDVWPPKAVASLEKGLKRLGRATSPVRDLDVALANLRTFARTHPENRKAIKQLRAELKSRRAAAHADLLQVLDSKKHGKFIKKALSFCQTAPASLQESDTKRVEILPTQLRHTLPSRILDAFERVRAYEVAFEGSDPPPIATLHALRIQTKYLRYILEFTHHLLGPQAEKLLPQLRQFQNYLGELNDAHFEAEQLHEWAEKLDDPALRETIQQRHAQLSAQMAQLAAASQSRLQTFIRPANRKSLAAAIAHL